MPSETCRRPGCENKLKTGKYYCSTKCSALDRGKRNRAIAGRDVIDELPAWMTSDIVRLIGENGAKAIAMETAFALEDEAIPLPTTSTTMGDWSLSFDGKQNWRPGDMLSWEKIEMMAKCGAVMFPVEMKRAAASRNFSEGRFMVESPDKELAKVALAVLNVILPRVVDELTSSSFVNGTYLAEQLWERKSKYQLGLSTSKSGTTEFLVPKVPNSVKPSTVDHIRRRNGGQEFDGFVQKNTVKSGGTLVISPDATAGRGLSAGVDDIVVYRPAALVVPFGGRFRNLWGRSILTNVYPTWLWYEIIMRTMARYMDRMATPVVVGRAPMKRLVKIEGQTTKVRAMDMMLMVAANIAKSNAAVIPSDLDENGKEQYSIAYLTAQERGQQFIEVLSYLNEEMSRGVVMADRSIMQSGGIGSKNIGEVHAQSNAIHNLLIELEILYYLNKYWIPNFSLFNRGSNGPPIRLVTQNADDKERDLLSKLMAITGNSKAGMMFQERIDYGKLGELSHIPMLSEAEAKRKMEQQFDEGLAHQEKQQQLMQKYSVNKDGNSQFGGIPPKDKPEETDAQSKQKAEEKEKSLELIRWALENNIRIPLVLSTRDMELLGLLNE